MVAGQDTYTANDYLGDTLLNKIQEDLGELFAADVTIVAELTAARDGEADLITKINAMDTATETVTTEVVAARDGEADLITKINAMDTATSTVTTEVVAARDGEASLLDQVNSLQLGISTVTSEVTAARDGALSLLAQIDLIQLNNSTVATEVVNARKGSANLLAQVDAIHTEIDSVTDEVTAARDGEASLLAQINALQAAIAALNAASGVLISLNDSTLGYLNGKLTAGQGITLTENNDGGNETLSVSVSYSDATDPANWNLVKTDGNFIVGNGTTFVVEDPATAKVSIGLGNVSNDAQLKAASNLSDLANLTTAKTTLGINNVPNEDATNPANWDPAKTDGNFLVGNGSTFVAESGATARASMGAIAATSYATSTTGGTVKARLNGTTAYFTINGNNA
jgi:septal ring factor EnvC (AmiA/AmiB activator)